MKMHYFNFNISYSLAEYEAYDVFNNANKSLSYNQEFIQVIRDTKELSFKTSQARQVYLYVTSNHKLECS